MEKTASVNKHPIGSVPWSNHLSSVATSRTPNPAGSLTDKNTFFAWQRNHMANERTFLAWCRTGISLIVFSFVIERFDLLIRELRVISPQAEKFAHLGKTQYMGVMIFILGAAIMLLAGWRFFYMRRHINQGDTEFSTLPDIFLLISVLVTLAMVFLLFVFLF